jgi:hypothetical protein
VTLLVNVPTLLSLVSKKIVAGLTCVKWCLKGLCVVLPAFRGTVVAPVLIRCHSRDDLSFATCLAQCTDLLVTEKINVQTKLVTGDVRTSLLATVQLTQAVNKGRCAALSATHASSGNKAEIESIVFEAQSREKLSTLYLSSTLTGLYVHRRSNLTVLHLLLPTASRYPVQRPEVIIRADIPRLKKLGSFKACVLYTS